MSTETKVTHTSGAVVVDDSRISCGCCRGESGRRCVCWMHQDAPWGRPAGTCSAHKHLSTTAQPFRYER
jgi:hypothetical protein